MDVLLLTPRLPFPPDRGDRLLAYRLLEIFATRHRVALLSFTDGSEPAGARDALAALGVEVRVVHRSKRDSLLATALGLAGRAPLQVAYYRSAAMARAARALRPRGGGPDAQFDVVAAQMIRMAPYAAVAAARRRIAILTDSIELSLRRRTGHEASWRRPLVALEAGRAGRYEREVVRTFDRSWLVSEMDRDHFPPELRPRIRVVPNGLPRELLDLPLRRPRPDTILFVGHLSVPHNIDASQLLARAILPRVRTLRPGVRLRLVGADPAPAVQALASEPGVEVVGFVPDLGGELAQAGVFAAPLRFGAGVQNKILEAMAAGLPVVASPVAAGGLGPLDPAGEVLRVAEAPTEWAERIAALLADYSGATAMAARARAHVAGRFRWENALEALELDGAPAVRS
jgi:glycosyltransferase involved in cell wall biosynthesis